MGMTIPQAVRSRAATILIFAPFLLAPLFADVQVGAKTAGFRLTDTAGKTHDLGDYAGKVLVLEFWSFKCPVSLAYDERMAALYSKYRSQGVSFLAVASNKNESPVEIRRNVENLKLAFPVLLDRDGMLADRLGATHTPSVFILDGSGILRYRGAVDNNKRAGERGRIAHVEDALNAILGGKPVPEEQTKVFGCGIRR
jgi:peroxiredoxin